MGQILFKDLFCRCDDNGDTGFVICSQKCGSVGGDDGVPFQVGAGSDHFAAGAQRDGGTLPVFYDLRLDIGARGGIGCVKMGDESQSRKRFTAGGCREFCVKVAFVSEGDIPDTESG